MPRETYAGPMPPEVSEKAVECAKWEIQELASHYGWTDEQLESELLEIAEYIDSVCTTDSVRGSDGGSR